VLVALALWAFAPATVGAVAATGTTPSPEPLWKAYPLNAHHPNSQRTPSGPTRPNVRSSHGGTVVEAVEIAGALAGVLAVAAGALALYRRSRRDSEGAASPPRRREPASPGRPNPRSPASQSVPDALPTAEHPRSDERDPDRDLFHSRGREVVVDLLDTLDLHGARKDAVPARDEDLVLVLCERARSATLAGDIEWRHAATDLLLWERAGGSLAIRSLNGDAGPPYELVVYDWNGARLDAVRLSAQSRTDPPVTKAAGTLYAAAHESASRIYEPIDTLIDALRGVARRS
jgi:hypothetical protein